MSDGPQQQPMIHTLWLQGSVGSLGTVPPVLAFDLGGLGITMSFVCVDPLCVRRATCQQPSRDFGGGALGGVSGAVSSHGGAHAACSNTLLLLVAVLCPQVLRTGVAFAVVWCAGAIVGRAAYHGPPPVAEHVPPCRGSGTTSVSNC